MPILLHSQPRGMKTKQSPFVGGREYTINAEAKGVFCEREGYSEVV